MPNLNDVMQHGYRVLTDEEKAKVQAIKDKGLEFYELLGGDKLGSREFAIAKTKVEEAVMWAVKGITK